MTKKATITLEQSRQTQRDEKGIPRHFFQVIKLQNTLQLVIGVSLSTKEVETLIAKPFTTVNIVPKK